MAGGGIKQAWDALLPAADKFPKEATHPIQPLLLCLPVGRVGKLKAMASKGD
jgi:hypothetical protein